MNNKIYSLESLRGIAALIIALYHYPSTSFLHFKDGYLAVYFFFCLSGFVITLNYFNKIISFNSLIKFQIKRYFRLYPVHVFTLLIILSIQLLKLILLKFFDFNSANDAFHPTKLYSTLDFLQHLFLTQSVTNFGYFLSWNAAAWTISAEFYAYLVFGLLTLIARGNKLIFIIILLFYILFSGLISLNFGNYINPVFLTCLIYFFSGCIVFFIYEKTKFRINDFFFLIFLFILIAYNKFYKLDNSILFSICIFLVLITKKDTFINKVLNFKPLVYFGTISYSFYMIHQPILYLYIQSLKLIFNVSFDNKNGVTTDTGDPYNDTLITISYIAISIIVSAIIYKYIEIKFRR